MTRATCVLMTGFAAAAAGLALLAGAAAATGDGDGDCCASSPAGAAFVSADQPTTRPAKKPEYPVDTCPVMDVPLDSKGKPVAIKVDGRDVKVCCQRCARAFRQDPAKYHAKLDDLIVAAQKDAYPLEACVVSGEKLGGMGEPVNYVHRDQNRLVRFCCAGCVDEFKKDPAKFLAKLDAAGNKGDEAGA